jgi:hypothetical protein
VVNKLTIRPLRGEDKNFSVGLFNLLNNPHRKIELPLLEGRNINVMLSARNRIYLNRNKFNIRYFSRVFVEV